MYNTNNNLLKISTANKINDIFKKGICKIGCINYILCSQTKKQLKECYLEHFNTYKKQANINLIQQHI